MSNLAVFDYNNNSVRIVEKNGEPWFVAKDLCNILDLANVTRSISRLDDDEKGIHTVNTLGGKQDMAIVSESGMYALVLSSRKPEAKPFRKWVTSEVLPSIRKTGQYTIATHPRLPQRDAIAYIEAAKEVETINNLSLQQLLRDELIDELSAKRGQKQLAGDPVQYTIVKVRARELGYSTADIGNGSALGKFVAKAIAPAFIERVGKYEVKHYQVNDALDTAIKTYFGMKHSLAS